MKTFLAILLVASAAFGQGTISPIKDHRGFIGGTFTGSGAGLTNVLATNYFGELRITDFANHITTPNTGSGTIVTNWNTSVSFGVGVNASLGYLTNNVAGYWKVSGEVTFNADDIENFNFYVVSNGVEIGSSTRSFTIAGATYNATVPIGFSTYLPEGTRISLNIGTDLGPSTNKITFAAFRIERQ